MLKQTLDNGPVMSKQGLDSSPILLQQVLDNRPDMQQYLFIRGFVITNGDLSVVSDRYPFYSNWNQTQVGTYYFWTHRQVKLFIVESNGKSFFLIGHAYNPYTMEYDEETILASVAQSLEDGNTEFHNKIDELTGIFIMGYIEGDEIHFLLDCSGMQYGCYGEIDGNIYITSHMQLIGDLFHLEMDEFVKRLISYKWFKYMEGNYLPGDLTAFPQLKRIIPNTIVHHMNRSFTVKRFYPNKPLSMCQNDAEYTAVIQEAARILHNSMSLIQDFRSTADSPNSRLS